MTPVGGRGSKDAGLFAGIVAGIVSLVVAMPVVAKAISSPAVQQTGHTLKLQDHATIRHIVWRVALVILSLILFAAFTMIWAVFSTIWEWVQDFWHRQRR